MNQDLVTRLKERARIRRQIATRKSVQEGKPDRIADLLEEAARSLEQIAHRETRVAEGRAERRHTIDTAIDMNDRRQPAERRVEREGIGKMSDLHCWYCNRPVVHVKDREVYITEQGHSATVCSALSCQQRAEKADKKWGKPTLRHPEG